MKKENPMKQRLIFLLTVSFISLLLLSSCSDRAVNISKHERLYSIGLMHNELLKIQNNNQNNIRDYVLDENGFMSIDNHSLMFASMRDYFVTEKGFIPSDVDNTLQQMNQVLDVIGAFEDIDGTQYVVPFDSTFIINSYIYARNAGYLTSKEKELIDPVINDYINGAPTIAIDEKIEYISTQLSLYNEDQVRKCYDFVEVYLASKDYWGDAVIFRYGNGVIIADAIGTIIGAGAYSWTGPGAVIGGAVLGAYYSCLMNWHNANFHHNH